jgi:hypothetical protein
MELKLSDKILLLLASHLANSLTDKQIRDLLVNVGICSLAEYETLGIMSKREKALKIMQQANSMVDDKSLYTHLELKLPALLDGGPIDARKEIERALALEGWSLSEFQAKSIAGKLAEPQEEESVLTEKLSSLDLLEVVQYLEQSYENYILGNYEACNAMTRTALESIIKLIAISLAACRNERIGGNKPRQYMPRDYRDYLLKVGFLDEDEHNLLRTFYSYASSEGSHPGLSDSTDARLRRFITVGLCLFYAEKLESQVQ